MQKKARLSAMAIISLIFSLLFFPIPVISGLTAIILGIIALYRIARYPDALRGRGFAITAIGLGIAQFLLVMVIFAFLVISSFYPHNQYRPYPGGNLEAFLARIRKNNKTLKDFPEQEELIGERLALVHCQLGSIYMDRQKYQRAIQEFDLAIKYNPQFYDPYQNKAVTYRLSGRFEDSVAFCKETARLFPRVAKTRCSLGWAYEKLGRYPEAIEAHLEAIRLSRHWQFPKNRISFCFSKLNNKKAALSFLSELEKLDSKLAKEIRKKMGL